MMKFKKGDIVLVKKDFDLSELTEDELEQYPKFLGKICRVKDVDGSFVVVELLDDEKTGNVWEDVGNFYPKELIKV